MPMYKVHTYTEFSKVVEVEADSPEEALDAWEDVLSDDWEESGDPYVSAVTDESGAEVWNMNGEAKG